MGKKNNPGCVCCDPECFRCSYKCDGNICPYVCGFRVNIADPEIVPSLYTTDPDDPDDTKCVVLNNEEICTDEAPCYACYFLFDRTFKLGSMQTFWPGEFGDCNNVGNRYTQLSEDSVLTSLSCWNQTNYNCPYEPSDEPQFCGAGLIIEDAVFESISTWNPDTNCGKISITITIKVFAPRCFESPIVPLRKATFVHLFELNYCTCEEMLSPIPFISTTSTNPDNLIDPCKLDQATITLLTTEESASCAICDCFECTESNTVNIAIDGPGFTGTVPVSSSPAGGLCTGYGTFDVECNGTKKATITLTIGCYDCEVYRMNILVRIGEEYLTAYIERYTCGSDEEFGNKVVFGTECQLNDYTFSL